IGDVLEDEGKALEDELGASHVRFIAHDVTSQDAWHDALALATGTFGGLDILVNNAGVLGFGGLDETNLDECRRIIDVNLVAQWLGTKLASTVMNPGGSIVNISSINGIVGGNRLTAYTSSKFGVTGLTK